MKKMYSSDGQQKYFVKLKREINSLKDENQELKKAVIKHCRPVAEVFSVC